MSSFMVGDDCINRIVTAVNASDRMGWYESYMRAAGVNRFDTQAFAEALKAMNARAMCERYREQDNGDIAITFRAVPAGAIVVFKSLQSFLYQCAEGEVVKSPLFELMERIKLALAEDIIGDLPEYRAVRWGE